MESHQTSISLKDLVYAPLEAISQANIRLSSNIVDFIKSTGDFKIDDAGKTLVNLRTVQMIYDKLRVDSEGNTVADSIGLDVPLLSIFPLSSLKVSKTKITFDAEIKSVNAVGTKMEVMAQACAKRPRSGNAHPQISYEIELDSVNVPEGLARFIDQLNLEAIPKVMSSKPIDGNGNMLTGKDLSDYKRIRDLRKEKLDLKNKNHEIKEQIRIKNISLKSETGMDYYEYSEHLRNNPSEVCLQDCLDIRKLNDIRSELEDKIEAIRQELIKIKLGVNAPADESDSDDNSDESEEMVMG